VTLVAGAVVEAGILLLLGPSEELIPLASAEVLVVASESTPDGDGAILPALEEDNAAIFTPVLLVFFTNGNSSLTFSCPCVSTFFAGTCLFEDDLLLFFDFEEDVLEVDLSSLALLDPSLLVFAFIIDSGFVFITSAAALARASASFPLGGWTTGLF